MHASAKARTWLIVVLAMTGCKEACGGQSATQQDANALQEAQAKPGRPEEPTAGAAKTIPRGLLVALAQFEGAKPGSARVELWQSSPGQGSSGGRGSPEQGSSEPSPGSPLQLRGVLEDPKSNVFHKALVAPRAFFASLPGSQDAADSAKPTSQKSGIVTLAGSVAAVRLWPWPTEAQHRGAIVSDATATLWQEDFGGKFSRMRDGEWADTDGDGVPELVLGTHDQGIVALLRAQRPDSRERDRQAPAATTPTAPAARQRPDGVQIEVLDQEKDTFIHEIEVGDVDGDGVQEIYATPSEPNRLDGKPQHGTVVRYNPGKGEGRKVVADLGNRHAKEILVTDLNGDGRDELYVAVEALTKGKDPHIEIVKPVEIRRYTAKDSPTAGQVIATLPDRLCRFLTAGDVDGDGRQELVAAAFRSGLWLLVPPEDRASSVNEPWQRRSIDKESGGFEHAALLTDLDGDGRDELYVGADEQGELRQYRWQGSIASKPTRTTILKRQGPTVWMTWNITAFPEQQ